MKIVKLSSLILSLILIAFLFFKIQKDDHLKNKNENKITVDQKSESKNLEKSVKKEIDFSAPLENSKERVTRKTFGIYITSQNSPTQPERFSGYHTGVDFEIFPEEENKEVSVSAICQGEILVKKNVSGYGGVLVQSCFLNSNPITVLYGHLNLESISQKIGEDLDQEEKIGNLGKGFSQETDSERKHLHLGIYKGKEINFQGYVQNENELKNWIDPCIYICE